MMFWKARFADPKWRQCKSSRIEENECIANAFYRKGVELDIVGMAEAGDKYAQACLGEMYQFGKVVDQNYSTAVKWYRKAAEQGHAEAQNRLGHMYENGQGVDINYLTAMEWYRKAAEQGHVYAQHSLGLMYQSWYRKAAEQGYV